MPFHRKDENKGDAMDSDNSREGLITLRSDFGPKETMDRLEAEITERGIAVFDRIDHANAVSGISLGTPHEQINDAAPRIAGGKPELLDIPAVPVA